MHGWKVETRKRGEEINQRKEERPKISKIKIVRRVREPLVLQSDKEEKLLDWQKN